MLTITLLNIDYIFFCQERDGYLNLTRSLEIDIQHLQAELVKTRNDWQRINNENLGYHEQIRVEREKLMILRNEKQCLLDKVSVVVIF